DDNAECDQSGEFRREQEDQMMDAGAMQLSDAEFFLSLICGECRESEQSQASNYNRKDGKQVQNNTHFSLFAESVVELFIHETILKRNGGINPGDLRPDTIDYILQFAAVFYGGRVESHRQIRRETRSITPMLVIVIMHNKQGSDP